MKNSAMKYIDNAYDGVTVAILGTKKEPVELDALNVVMGLCRKNSKYLDLNFMNGKIDDMLIRKTFKGVSKCNLEFDDYDQDIGRDIAKRRCLDKHDEAVNRKVIDFLNDIYSLEAAVENFLYERDAIEYDDCTCDNCNYND